MNFQDVIRDVHDPSTHSLQTSGGGATIFAVVNTAAAGQASVVLDSGVNNIGFATVSVSNPTLYAVVNTAAVGVSNSMVTINPRTDYIGLMSISGGVDINAGVNNIGFATVTPTTTARSIIGNITIEDGGSSITVDGSVGIIGNVTLANQPALVASSAYIGLASVNIGGTLPALSAGVANIGFATVKVDTGTKYIGLATVDMGVNKAWANPNTFIGLVTVAPHALTAGVAGIGFATVNIVNQPALVAGSAFIGLTSIQGNVNIGGTNKILIIKPIAISASGNATIFVPSNTFKVTHLTLGSDATVRVTILSGASYLAGNASVGITLLPGGGWVENGQPQSPIYIGLAGAASFVVNTSATANVGGKVIYFDE